MNKLTKILNGKTVWVTGASSGIGAALAQQAAQSGAQVILSSRREAALQKVIDAMDPSIRSNCHIVVLDLADPDSIAKASETVQTQFGALDVVIHNGGISQRALAADTQNSVVRSVMETNFMGAVALTHATLPLLRKSGGRYVVISSMVGLFGVRLRSAYSASKHALHGYFESLAAEEYDNGVRVTIVCPGFVRTEVSKNAVTADGSAHNQLDDAQANAMSADECASQIWQAVDKDMSLVIVSGAKEKFAALLSRYAPNVLRKMMRTAKVT